MVSKLEPNFDTPLDLRLDTITADTAKYLVSYSPDGNWAGYKTSLVNVRVKITNVGQNTIDSISIRIPIGSFTGICTFTQYGIVTFDSLNLLPNSSTIVTIPQINKTISQLTSQPFVPIIQHCFNIILPNDSLDANYLDNYQCHTFDLLLHSNELQTTQPLTIYPNPSTGGDIHLQWGDAQATLSDDHAYLEIYNATGALVYARECTNNGTSTIQAADLQQVGWYFVRLRTEDAVYSGKVGVVRD